MRPVTPPSGPEMKPSARLGLYGLALVYVFAVAGLTANAVIDEDTVQAWMDEAPEDHEAEPEDETMNSGGHQADAASLGLGLARDGYQLADVSAPTETGTDGELSLTVTGTDGAPVTDFELDHEQEMHLIAVRADGQHFRHVHPQRRSEERRVGKERRARWAP